MGDSEAADQAYANHIRNSTRDPRLLEPALALAEGRIAVAEPLLRKHLKQFPTDVAAIRMLAEVASRIGRYADAENLLARCLELAPSFSAARHNYAVVLHRHNKPVEALAQIDELLAAEPRSPSFRNLKAAVLARVGEYDEAIRLYEQLLREYPRQAKVWLSYGHALKTAGRQDDSIAAYRKSIELEPRLGETYWSLANLKTFRFSPADVAAMRAQLERSDLTQEDRFHFHFALGKAEEDAKDYADSFHHYAEGNRLRKEAVPYDSDTVTENVRRSRALFTPEFFAARSGSGSTAPDPIFVVGLPRSGSTLVEQILSSHSAIEGTMELPDVVGIVKELSGRNRRSEVSKYPEVLESLAPDALRELGERYLQQTRVQRKTDAPFFIDKLPNNWAHVGLIQLMLPNARIIDARRHPLSCCFSGFKQHFARGQNFSYWLDDIGRYYADYVDADGALRCRAARPRPSRDLRAHGRRHRKRSATPARVLRPAVRGRLPAVLRERPRRAHRQLRTGAPADLPRRGRPLAPLRTLARPAQGRARPGARRLSRSAAAAMNVVFTHPPTGASLREMRSKMTRSRKRKLQRLHGRPSAMRALAASVPTLLAGMSAYAQTTSGGLEEIVVTAQKRSEDLQSVPISIQAIGTRAAARS